MLKFLHRFVTPKTDSPDSTIVKPGAWNDGHDFTSESVGIVVGRNPADTPGVEGPLEELPLAIELDGSLTVSGTGQFTPPGGTTAQRPTTPRPGSLRFNLDTSTLEVFGLNGAAVWTTLDAGSFLRAGTVVAYAGNTIPARWFKCEGQALNRTTEAALFGAIGTIYGAGNGTTTFNVPNYQGVTLVGVDGVLWPSVGVRAGNYTTAVSLNANNVPPHKHTLGPFPAPFDGGGGTSGGGNALVDSGGVISETDFSAGPVVPFNVSTLQPSVGAYLIIKG